MEQPCSLVIRLRIELENEFPGRIRGTLPSRCLAKFRRTSAAPLL